MSKCNATHSLSACAIVCRPWAVCCLSSASSLLHLESSRWLLCPEHSISPTTPSTLNPYTLLYVSYTHNIHCTYECYKVYHSTSGIYMINQTSRRLDKAKQINSTRLRKSFFQRKIGCLRWDSNPRHSAL